ncbi:MAG: hypothetical protein ACOC01_02020 [Bacteroidales bacterium]
MNDIQVQHAMYLILYPWKILTLYHMIIIGETRSHMSLLQFPVLVSRDRFFLPLSPIAIQRMNQAMLFFSGDCKSIAGKQQSHDYLHINRNSNQAGGKNRCIDEYKFHKVIENLTTYNTDKQSCRGRFYFPGNEEKQKDIQHKFSCNKQHFWRDRVT